MNDQELGRLALMVAGTERLLEKFSNFGGLTDRILELYRQRMAALAKADGLRLLSSARQIVAMEE